MRPNFTDLKERSPFVAQRVARLEKALALDLPYPAVRAALELLKETGDEEAHKEASRRVEAYYRERGGRSWTNSWP